MADKLPPLPKGFTPISEDLPPLPKGFTPLSEKKNPVQPVAPTTSKPLSTGSNLFQAQVDTSAPSFLNKKEAEKYREQVKDYVPPVQKQPKLPKEKPLSNLESVKNTVYNIANSLKGVLPRLSLTSMDVFEKVIGKDLTGRLASLPRIEFSSDGVDIVTGRTPEQIRNESLQSLDYLNEKTKPTAGIVENARNFNIPGLAAGIVDAAGGLVSTLIPAAASGGSLLVTEMVGRGLYDYNTEKAKAKGISTQELYKRGDADFGVPASIGGIGYAMERAGLKGFTNSISKKLAGSGYKKALLLGTEWNKEGWTEWVQVGLDEANLALAKGLSIEDAVELATSKMASVQGLEAYAKGFAGSASASGVGRAAKRLVSPKNKAKVTELEQQKNQAIQDLANDNIPLEAKESILEVLENTTEQIDDIVNTDIKETDGLDENQKIKVSEINSKVEGIDAAIENENTSESTKSILEKQKQELESELDTIISEVKVPQPPQPRIETEEDVVKEIRAAEKEFNETGDAAEYQLKINDLNQRLENLVPEPEVEGEAIAKEDVEAKKADIERRRQEEIKSITDEVDGMTKEQQEKTASDRISRRVAANSKYDAELAALEQPTQEPTVDALKDEDIILSGLNEGFVGVSRNSFDLRSDPNIMRKIEGNKSFATRIIKNGKNYIVVGTRLGGIESDVSGRDGYSFATIEDNGNLPDNIVDILTEKSVSNMSSIYPNSNNLDIDTNIDIDNDLLKPQTDAIPQSKPSKVPVLTETTTSKEVEQGKPEAKPEGVAEEGVQEELTPAQQVEQLRADEQAELNEAIPNAAQYQTDGKVDRAKITDAKDLKTFDEIYDKYDKLISPLLPKKETKAEAAPAKEKAAPRLKTRTQTLKDFTKAIELFNDISAADGAAKKGTLSRKRQKFLAQNPSIKYIDDNWKNISKQLEAKGLITKEGNCP